MKNPELSNNTLLDELFNIYIPDISQRFSFDQEQVGHMVQGKAVVIPIEVIAQI